MVYDDALCCSVLHCVAVRCSVLHCVAVCDIDGLRHSSLREFLLCVGYTIPQRMAEREDRTSKRNQNTQNTAGETAGTYGIEGVCLKDKYTLNIKKYS